MRLPKYLKDAHRESTRLGWTWDHKGSQHVVVRDGRGEYVVTLSLTAYDGTVTKRVKSALRKAGCPQV